MLTFQDLQKVGDSDFEKMRFIRTAINQHKNSDLYKTAYEAEQYARHKNITINDFQKLLYTVSGQAVPDNWSANYKMSSNFYNRFITQEVQYLLGNGISWTDPETANKLGTEKYPIATQLQKAGKHALNHAVSFGFWNFDHVDVFSFLEFVPLYDEINGSLSAGIRFWQIDSTKPLRATLYELDGYTEYIWESGKESRVLQPKRMYKVNVKSSIADGEEIYSGSNYDGFPIVPYYGNSYHQSEFIGLREQIDCFDLIKSGFANSVDEASIVYWTITNAGGMDDIDLARFIERLKTVHAHTFDDQEQVQSHTLDAPFASREALLTRLENDLYKDAMALNTETIASGATTATQIRAAYEPLNSKTDDFEYCTHEFLKRIMLIAGVEDEPSFTRSMIVNVTEEIQTVLQAATYLDSDYVVNKVLTLLGDSDKVADVLQNMDMEDYARMNDDTDE